MQDSGKKNYLRALIIPLPYFAGKIIKADIICYFKNFFKIASEYYFNFMPEYT